MMKKAVIASFLCRRQYVLSGIPCGNSFSGAKYPESSQKVLLTAWLLWFWRNRQRPWRARYPVHWNQGFHPGRRLVKVPAYNSRNQNAGLSQAAQEPAASQGTSSRLARRLPGQRTGEHTFRLFRASYRICPDG